MLSIWARKVRRSTNYAVIRVGFSNNSVQRENSRLVLTITLLLSARSEITLKSSSDWWRLKLKYDNSSIIKRSAFWSWCSSFSSSLVALYAKQLRIPSFTRYQEVLRQQEQLSYEDFLIAMMGQELASQGANQQKRRIKQAGFPVQKTLEEFDFKRLKHVEEAYIHKLAS